jgi:hypothetical protein
LIWDGAKYHKSDEIQEFLVAMMVLSRTIGQLLVLFASNALNKIL